MDEFDSLKEMKDKNLHGVLGYAASILLFLSQFAFWFLKKWREVLFKKTKSNPYTVKGPFFHSFGEVSRLDIFLIKNLSVVSSEVFYLDLVSLYKSARERNLESIKIEFAHYGTVSLPAKHALKRFLDYVTVYNGLRLVLKFPTNSQDTINLYFSLQRHRAKSNGGRIELYLNDYSEDRSKKFLERSPIP
ncbi:hypothetical protein [Leptospira weilii]|uniref:Uncharacterized protein n=1 Tax=Leptospira weilii str. UI 13098 TaxID=1088542 RepID=M6QP14_9LEPT|nr:hypothetical protein [Leptospira weilii]EMN90602.1 hypothetical protein LEP1GSC108_3359 [Leptospira weilii str. UI 13098]